MPSTPELGSPPLQSPRSQSSDPVCYWRRFLIAGLAAGTVGIFDALLVWSSLGRFLPGVTGRLGALLHIATLYAVMGALVLGLSAVALRELWQRTAFTQLWAALCRRLAAIQRGDTPLAPTIYASLVVICFGITIWGTFGAGLHLIMHRRHKGLVVAVIMAITLAAILAASVGTLVAGAILARFCRGRLVGKPTLTRVLFWLAPLLLLATGIGSAAYMTRGTLTQLPLRAPLAVAAAVTLQGLLEVIYPHVVALCVLTRSWKVSLMLLTVCLTASLGLGTLDTIRKAASSESALAGGLVRAIRRTVDLDRDGFSAILGGGDCNDWNASIHPGANDLPGDGIDQNCAGGDAPPGAAHEAPTFVALPQAVPTDANIVLITVDALRADHLGMYGYHRPTSPTLDALAATGARFENAWAHAPSTRYSIPAILTGRYPSTIRWDHSVWWPALAPDARTIAEVLKDRGFHTGAILNYHYFDRIRRMDQGFDEYDNRNARLHQGKDPSSTSGTSAREQADLAVAYLRRHKSDRFFLWVHFYDPHYRYERHPGTRQFGDEPVDLYDHEIRFTDQQIGRIISTLEEEGIDQRTIVAVTADHGEGFGERGINLHGYHLYAPQTKVPLVIRVPGLKPRTIRTPVGHVDILPTLANLAGAKSETRMLGESLLPLLSGARPDSNRQVFQEVTYEGPTERRAVVNLDWQLIYNARPDNSYELYSLRNDPRQERDVYAPDKEPELQRALLRWIDRLNLGADGAEALAKAFPKARPQPQHATPATFGDIQLLGFDLASSTGTPIEVARRGSPLVVRWHFYCERPLARDWRIFVHIEGPGRFLGDHKPVGGALPFNRWPKARFVTDEHKIYVPRNIRPGDYTIYFGLFAGNDRHPLQSTPTLDGGSNRLKAGTLKVR